MYYNPDKGFPRAVAAPRYRHATEAVEWLCRVFGFREVLRWEDDGGVGHSDLELEGAIVMVDRARGHWTAPDPDEPPTTVNIIFVSDVDAHYERAVAEGATPDYAPEDRPWGLRQYTVRDIEGHAWEFTQHVEDVPAPEWGAVAFVPQE
jgi:uncharacterized glyoxalase superfamily protein PhnB